MKAGLEKKYFDDIVPQLRETLGLSNRMSVPRLMKIVVNMGIGSARRESANALAEELARITGQRPVLTKARKSISNFKLRGGAVVGAKVTLRGRRMYEFLDRLISAALPRIRDFRGLPASAFDGRGSYTIGIREQIIFPEIDPDAVSVTQGMDVTLVTSAANDDGARALLKLMGVPLAAN
ncbi:MAG: 50S ribosomal protein L5 [Lentisphaerae bacterium]|nr:50S ribosomal protein L5 [Lentisphaerota bacterium]